MLKKDKRQVWLNAVETDFIAFSNELDTGSRQENASIKIIEPRFLIRQKRKGSSRKVFRPCV
jgi:hypothetical protein